MTFLVNRFVISIEKQAGEEPNMVNPSQDLSIVEFRNWWRIAYLSVFVFLVVGLLCWKDLALTIAPPGFPALVGFLTFLIGVGLSIGLVRIRIKYRNNDKVSQ